MRHLRIPLRAVLYKEAGVWIAHCLEFDLLGDGETPEEALHCLSEAIVTQLDASIKFGNMANLFTPAEGKYFEMYAAGVDVFDGELQIKSVTDSVTIESMKTRAYSDVNEGCGDLVEV
jgi:predicted RNase H-like HicB family nuclease